MLLLPTFHIIRQTSVQRRSREHSYRGLDVNLGGVARHASREKTGIRIDVAAAVWVEVMAEQTSL
jgi:hypothetical protein